MHYVLPDPYPGRCLNERGGHRCLDYDAVPHMCTFPEIVAGVETVVAVVWAVPVPLLWVKPG